MTASLQEFFRSLTIQGVTETGVEIGRGAYGVVVEVKWMGLNCAAKRIHPALIPDIRGPNKVVQGFLDECSTWATLRHPHIVQFLGLYFERSSPLPVLVMEKLSTSLRRLLELYPKERLSLCHKISILHQTALGLLYLHCSSPPLVHRDLTANNVLLDVRSLTAKLTDFGMVRAMDGSRLGTLTEVPGVVSYMPPEAFWKPPNYSVKLDVFSFGVLVIHSAVHEWPDPLPGTDCDADGTLQAITEVERRQTYMSSFSDLERELFLPIIVPCLQNQPDARPDMHHVVVHLEDVRERLGVSDSLSMLEVELERENILGQLQVAAEGRRQLELECRQLQEQLAQQHILPQAQVCISVCMCGASMHEVVITHFQRFQLVYNTKLRPSN